MSGLSSLNGAHLQLQLSSVCDVIEPKHLTAQHLEVGGRWALMH